MMAEILSRKMRRRRKRRGRKKSMDRRLVNLKGIMRSLMSM